LDFGGDLRYRHERTDKDDVETRNRQRARVRFGFTAEVNSNVTASIRIASGSDAPFTSDQSMDDSFSGKDIHLDRVQVDWLPHTLPGLQIIAGKMENPLFRKRGLVWDGDVTPEGAALKYTKGDDALKLLATADMFWVEERSEGDDTVVHCGQVAAALKTGTVGFLAGAGYTSYDNMKGFTTLYDDLKGFGNSTVAITDESGEATELLYATDFNQVDGFVEVSANVGPIPCKALGHYVVNTEADDDDTGYLVGFQIGKTREPGSLQLDYDWRELEADAVVGIFADSNVWGGGTDGRGHRAYVGYQIAHSWKLGLEFFVSEIGLDGSIDYKKLRLEVKAKF